MSPLRRPGRSAGAALAQRGQQDDVAAPFPLFDRHFLAYWLVTVSFTLGRAGDGTITAPAERDAGRDHFPDQPPPRRPKRGRR